MTRLLALLLLTLSAMPLQAAEEQDYLYYRDVTIPSFQNLREFFNLPNRPGTYQVTLVSDAIGPLTFRIVRVEEDVETEIKRHRSYRVGDHEFHFPFDNPDGKFDLIVEMANSNPVGAAKVAVIVVEQP
jgi:hypothetical protein